ncbi:MAG: hypothetical protein JO269_07520 [Burkholderiaceae bacterium]|nr:hypothetical protein [Burkholderiaceae bacterium]
MQEFIVAVIVACAALVVAKRYAPAALKRATRSRAAKAASRLGWNKLAAKIEQQAEAGASCADGCGSCGGCGPGNASEENTVNAPTAPIKHTVVSLENLRQNLRR